MSQRIRTVPVLGGRRPRKTGWAGSEATGDGTEQAPGRGTPASARRSGAGTGAGACLESRRMLDAGAPKRRSDRCSSKRPLFNFLRLFLSLPPRPSPCPHDRERGGLRASRGRVPRVYWAHSCCLQRGQRCACGGLAGAAGAGSRYGIAGGPGSYPFLSMSGRQ